jgi:hypothetical protein
MRIPHFAPNRAAAECPLPVNFGLWRKLNVEANPKENRSLPSGGKTALFMPATWNYFTDQLC